MSDTENTKSKEKKRISPTCLNFQHKVNNTKKFLISFFLLLIILPILYLIPCATTYLTLQVNNYANCTGFLTPAYQRSTHSNPTLNISSYNYDSNYTTWSVESIDLYFNSYTPNINKTSMIQYIAYNKTDDHLFQTNTLHLNLFRDLTHINQFESFNAINGLYRYYKIPVDYILSYMKITISNSQSDTDFIFSTDFYYFFMGDSCIEIKYQLISQITLNSLKFDPNAYQHWLNWQTHPTEIPTDYPYMINLELRRYNSVTTLFGVYSI